MPRSVILITLLKIFYKNYSVSKQPCIMEQITLTDEHKKILFGIPLFEGLSNNKKITFTDRLDYVVYDIQKNDIIARQNTPCKSLYILLEGQLRVDIIDGFGNNVMIEDIIAPRAFATPHLFSKDHTLPATFTVTIKGTLLKATKESVFKLISEEPDLLKNFLCVTGNCNVCTVTRLHALTQKTVRNRIVVYLLEKKHADRDWVIADHNNSQLADYLCVTRPALSKEINKMAKEGLIAVEGKKIHILALDKLKQVVL